MNLESPIRFLFPGLLGAIGVALFLAGQLHVPGLSRSGGGDTAAITSTVERYYKGFADADTAAVCGSTSTNSMAQWTRGTAGCEAVVQSQIMPSIPQATRASFASVKVHEVIVEDRLAQAEISFDGGQHGPVYLERVSERWMMRSLHPLRAP
ncbi:MAG TPA: hypothetical protein VHF45_03560 [Thermoleophilaceae bacterium]|nr:hypothetical protein [Thermoleophilaceae bacterium]